MGARRRIVAILLLASLVATVAFVTLAIDATGDANAAAVPPAQAPDSDPTGPLAANPQPGLVEEYPAGGTLGLIYWAVAFVSGTLLMVSGLLVRREVRIEKNRIRRRRVQEALAADMQDFHRSQGTETRRHT